jgi:phosphate starvation-inducible PhoH-like protein
MPKNKRPKTLSDDWRVARNASVAGGRAAKRPRSVTPKTAGQARYWQALLNHPVVFCDGPGGTGKTLLACAAAAARVLAGQADKVVVVRPAVAGEDLGYLPGGLDDKVGPFLRHVHDIFADLLPDDPLAAFGEHGRLEFEPLGFMRGTTLTRTAIVADEFQNATPKQFHLLLTRLGQGATVFITGDWFQADIPNSGLGDAMSRFEHPADPDFAVVRLTDEDVVRSELVKKVEKRYRRPAGSAPPPPPDDDPPSYHRRGAARG